MGLLARINVAVFTVPLGLSSLLLRALHAAYGLRRQPTRKGERRRAITAGATRPSPRGLAGLTPLHPNAVKAMGRELGAVLDGHEGSREVFRYLAHFEHRFAKHGMRTLAEMPTERLRRALAQFEAIVSNWSSPQLADLRSRMAVAVTERDSGATMWAPAQTISKAYGPRRMPMLTASRCEPVTTDFQATP